MQRIYKSIKKISYLSFLIGLFFANGTQNANAGATLSLSPSTGTYTGQFQVDVNVAISGGDTIYAFDLNIEYSGPIDFISGTSGDAGCGAVIDEATPGTVSIICLALDPISDSTIATLTFGRSTTGTANIEIEVIDSDGTIDAVSGGTYSMLSGSSGLPSTAINSNYLIWAGFLMVLLGGTVYLTAIKPESIFDFLYRIKSEENSETLKDKIR